MSVSWPVAPALRCHVRELILTWFSFVKINEDAGMGSLVVIDNDKSGVCLLVTTCECCSPVPPLASQ